MKILLFAQLSEITGAREIVLPQMRHTDELVGYLNRHHPGFSGATYIIAVEKEVIQGNTALNNHSTIAFLPPFAGG